MARVVSGATCDESSQSDQAHTCLSTLLNDGSHWEADGEGQGAWIKVSFPRANVRALGVKSACSGSDRVKTLTADMDSTGNDLVDVSDSYHNHIYHNHKHHHNHRRRKHHHIVIVVVIIIIIIVVFILLLYSCSSSNVMSRLS